MAKQILAAAFLVTAALATAACDGPSSAERAAAPPATPLAIGNPFHDRMLALSPLQREAALRNAIRTAREPCDRVEAAAFQQDHENLKMWTASCQRRAYAVFVAPNGDVQVRTCADLASLRLPTCREASPAAS